MSKNSLSFNILLTTVSSLAKMKKKLFLKIYLNTFLAEIHIIKVKENEKVKKLYLNLKTCKMITSICMKL